MSSSAGPDPKIEAIVALGASAGGLEALDGFFSALDQSLPAAFVVIQHLSPSHETMMDTLLGRHTRMPVHIVKEGMALELGHVYVIPAGVTLTVSDKRFHLDPRPVKGAPHPINAFFDSLPQSGYDRLIGVVLSGTGSDGSAGLKSVVEAGGWALAQSPDTAAFDGMPLNAMATGLVYKSGNPSELAATVEQIVREGARPVLMTTPDNIADDYQNLLQEISDKVQINLDNYKPHTILRRLERRMLATGKHDLPAYLAQLDEGGKEAMLLRREMLIPVTAFFRDADAFQALTSEVIKPRLQAAAQGKRPMFRAWSVGCATGQEAYSLAITVLEAMRETGLDLEFKLFATDIERSYLDVASAGKYPERLLQSLPPDILARYFIPTEDRQYQVNATLRRAIVFSQHDVLGDPPFLDLDLVVCRNLLIYFRAEAQDRALRRMLFGLQAGGGLFLGSSEALGPLAGHLETLSSRNKLYRAPGRMRHLSGGEVLMKRRPIPVMIDSSPSAAAQSVLHGDDMLSRGLSDALMGAFVPPSVVVDNNREVRHVFGDVTPYLRFRDGGASLDLMQLLPIQSAAIVSTVVMAAFRNTEALHPIILHPEDDPDLPFDMAVKIETRRLPETAHLSQPMVLLSFVPMQTVPAEAALPPEARDLATLSASRATELEGELARVRATLKSTVEELGSANEELQASNEELMASIEELQSTNEELQSVNEELHTVNAELQEKILQLNEAYADLEGLSRAARIPLVFLDSAGTITRFSAQATEIFRLRDQDIGRPLADITNTLHQLDLEALIAQALDGQKPLQLETTDRQNRSWLVSVQPFMGRNAHEARVVLSFIDVSSVQDMRFLQSVVDATPQNLAVLDLAGTIVIVNESWRRFAEENGANAALINGRNINYLEVLKKAATSEPGQLRVLEGLQSVLSGEEDQFSTLYPCHSKREKRWFLMHSSSLRDGGCVVTHLDVTNLRQARKTKEQP